MNERQGIDVAKVLGIVAKRWKTVLAITLLAAMAAYGYVTFMAKEVFESTALVTYQSPDKSTNPTGGALPSSGITREDIGTLVANATSAAVVEAAATEVGIEPADLRRSVRVQAHGEASVVAFIGRGATADEATERANAWANAFVSDRVAKAKVSLDALVKERAANLAAANKVRQDPEDPDPTLKNAATQELYTARSLRQLWTGALSVSNAAQVPDQAIWPRKSLTMFAALVIGLGIGSGVALLTARVDNRLKGDDLDTLPAPVLARVPISPRAPKSSPLGPAMAEPIVADSFAALGSRVMIDRFGEGAHVILVTSARSGEGKSSVAANLASALALGGRRVVLVDADMRRPTQDQVFPMLQNRPGLSQVLTRGAELESALTLVAPNLAAIGSGPRHNNASVLLASVALRQMLERLSQISEVIVVDAPPVLAVNDALAVAPAANQVLLVARVNASDVNEVSEAHARLASAAQTPQAMVLVGTERPEGYGYDQEMRAHAPRIAMPATAPQAAATPARPTAHPQAPGALPQIQQLPHPGAAADGHADGAVAWTMAGFRALHVTDYASAYEGAFIRQLRMLDEELRARGGRSSALCLTGTALARPWVDLLRRDGWELRELPAGSTRPQRGVARAIADAVLELRPDVVHVHFGTYDLSTRLALRRLRRRLGADMPKLVWHYRTALEQPVAERSWIRRTKDRLKFERAGRDVDLFVGVTRALGEEVAERGAPADRARGIVAGCDTDTFRYDGDVRRRVRESLGVADDDVLLMHMGWSWHRKGGDLLAEAVRSLEAGDGPRIVACSIGAPEDALLGPVRALPISDRVHEYHQASDIFISASRSEGFGNGLVEAMACERVAVAAAAEGQVETFAGLAGVLTVPVGDADALARAIRSLLERRRSWASLGTSNRAHVIDHHSMRRWARDMADAYAELVPAHLETRRELAARLADAAEVA